MSVTQVQTIGITNDAVTATQIAAGAVGTTEIAANAVTATQIAAGAVGTTEIAANAVTATQIAAGAVGTTEIAANAVTTEKINFQNALVPVGGIIMWSGSIGTIPTGWALCNGAPGSGTPDLTNRFIVGAGSGYAVAGTGGSADATLVSHTHTVTSTSAADGGIFKSFFVSIARILQFPPLDAINSFARGPVDGDFSDTVASSVGRGSLDSAGSPATNANLPPYYALAFIMRTS